MVAGVRWVALGWVLEMGEPGACHRQMRKQKADDTGTRGIPYHQHRREGGGFNGAEKNNFISRASVFSVKWDMRFPDMSQGEEGCDGLEEGLASK